jgi:hypothetical protein
LRRHSFKSGCGGGGTIVKRSGCVLAVTIFEEEEYILRSGMCWSEEWLRRHSFKSGCGGGSGGTIVKRSGCVAVTIFKEEKYILESTCSQRHSFKSGCGGGGNTPRGAGEE